MPMTPHCFCRNEFRKCREEQQAFEQALKAGRIKAR